MLMTLLSGNPGHRLPPQYYIHRSACQQDGMDFTCFFLLILCECLMGCQIGTLIDEAAGFFLQAGCETISPFSGKKCAADSDQFSDPPWNCFAFAVLQMPYA